MTKKDFEKICELYDTKIELLNPQLGDYLITVKFMCDNIETIAEVISETMGWQVENLNEIFIKRAENRAH